MVGPSITTAQHSFSAVLLSWKRPQNLPVVIESLRAIRHIAEIVVWNNNPEHKLVIDEPDVLVINAPKNYKCFARYCVAPLASHNDLWFQDDDVCLAPEQFNLLLRHYLSNPARIYGCRGRAIENGRYVAAERYGDVDIIIGQTLMFHRSLLAGLFGAVGKLPPIEEDDIAFSLSLGRKHRAVHVGKLRDLGMSDAAALHKQSGHFARRQNAVEVYGRYFAQRRSEIQRQQHCCARIKAIEKRARRRIADSERSYALLKNSASVRLVERAKRLPGVYAAYHYLKRIAERTRSRPERKS